MLDRLEEAGVVLAVVEEEENEILIELYLSRSALAHVQVEDLQELEEELGICVHQGQELDLRVGEPQIVYVITIAFLFAEFFPTEQLQAGMGDGGRGQAGLAR